MIRFCLRLLGLCLLAVAFITFLMDALHSSVGGIIRLTSLSQSLTMLLPGKLASLQDFIDRHLTPFLYDPVLVTVLRLPVWLVSGLAGMLCLRLGAKSAPKFGFSSR